MVSLSKQRNFTGYFTTDLWEYCATNINFYCFLKLGKHYGFSHRDFHLNFNGKYVNDHFKNNSFFLEFKELPYGSPLR
jgi:hypothetical protein